MPPSSRRDDKRSVMIARAALLLTLFSLIGLNAYAAPKADAEADPDPSLVSVSQSFATTPPGPKNRAPALIDTALYTSVLAWRTMDFFSTEQCIHSPHCSERELPTWLVQSRPAFATFEIASAAGEIMASRWLHAHGHGRLARACDIVSVSSGTWAVAHNYAVHRY
jgi:hypothetical protein